MAKLDTDVLVIGAGPAGSSAAMSARRAGVSVLIVERSSHVGDSSRSLGFVPTLFADGASLPHILMRQRIESTRIHLDDEVIERRWPGYTIPVRNLFRIMAGTASSMGAQLRSGLELVGLTPTGAASFRSPGGDLEVRSKAVVACDGARSRAAELLELPPLPTLAAVQCEVLLLAERAWIDVYLRREIPGGYAWLFPRRTSASVGVALAAQPPEGASAVLERFRNGMVDEGLIGPQFINKTEGVIPCGGVREVLRIGQVILAGDAAGTAHPTCISGIGPAIESGTMAGASAAAYVSGRGDALRAYQQDMHAWLRPSHTRAIARKQFMMDAWNRIPFSRLMRETCLV